MADLLSLHNSRITLAVSIKWAFDAHFLRRGLVNGGKNECEDLQKEGDGMYCLEGRKFHIKNAEDLAVRRPLRLCLRLRAAGQP